MGGLPKVPGEEDEDSDEDGVEVTGKPAGLAPAD